ncbi:transposase [Streptomyces mirabilis]|nr:transposase [Streptomyces mirabilis]
MPRAARTACSATSTDARDGPVTSSSPAGRTFVAALETGRTSWCQLLDAVRLGPDHDVAEVTAAQVRRVVTDLIAQGQWEAGDDDILVVFDAGYDAPRMAHLLGGLPPSRSSDACARTG